MTTDLPKTDESLPIALIRAREALMGPIREMLTEAGLTEQQWRVLRVLEERGKSDATAVANSAAISAPSLSRILVGLENRHLISRQNDTYDRRRQRLTISDAGKALITTYRGRVQARASVTRDRLGKQKYDHLIALLSEISDWKDNP